MKHAVDSRKDFNTSELVVSFEIRISHNELAGSAGDMVREDLDSLKQYWLTERPTRAPDGQGRR
jgi:hypothetical protein